MIEVVNFKLERFEGPLDLMLSLISKHKLDIQDIEISVLLEQFLDYIDRSRENDIELAGEFLETAAHLIYIKSVSLLPKHEAEELKRELEGALIEYALCKAAAERLRERYVGDIIFTRGMINIEVDMTYNFPHSVSELFEANAVTIIRKNLRKPPPFSMPIDEINVSYVSVFSKILFVLRRIKNAERGEAVEIETLFKDIDRSSQVATFMALLELSSHGRITFSDDSKRIEFVSPNKD